MAEVGSAFVSILPSARGFGSKLNSEVGGEVDSAGKATGSRFGNAFKVGALAAVAGAAFAAKFLGGAIQDASDLAEAESKVGVVFGKSAAQIMAASQTSATAMGLTKSAYLGATGTLGNLLVSLDIAPKKAAGLSQEMVKLAGDLASFNNTSPEEALDALRAGLVGETEPLKRFGVNMNEATLKAQALKMGLIQTTTEALDPQAKALAAQALIMKQTGTAQGDFARTSGGLANQQRILAAQFGNLKATIGSALLPLMTRFVTFLNGSIVPGVKSFIAGMQSGSGAGGVFAAAVQTIFAALTQVGSAFLTVVGFINQHRTAAAALVAVITALVAVTSLHAAVMGVAAAGGLLKYLAATNLVTTATKVYTAVQWLLNAALSANPIGIVIVALTALAAGLVLAYKKSETFRNIVNGAFSAVRAVVTTVVNATKTVVLAAWNAIRTGTAAVWNAIRALTATAWNVIKNTVLLPVRVLIALLQGDLGKARGIVDSAWRAVESVTKAAWAAIKNAVQAGIDAAMNLVKSLPDKARDALGNLGSVLYNAGAELIQGLIDGITSKIAAVGAKMAELSSKVKGFLPGSPVKEGPLRSWNNGGAGKRLIDMLVDGIKKQTPAAARSSRGVADGVMAAFVGGVDDGAPKVLEKFEALRDGLKSEIEKIRGDFASLSSAISDAFGGDPFEATSARDFVSNLFDTKGQLTELRRAFKKLTAMGVAPAFLSSLFQSGNASLILDLAGGAPSQARMAAQLFGDVESLGGKLGNQVARNQYGKQLDSALDELQQIRKAIKLIGKDVGNEVNAAVSRGSRRGER